MTAHSFTGQCFNKCKKIRSNFQFLPSPVSRRVACVLGLSFGSLAALAQTPFTCNDGKSYLFQGTVTDAYEIDLLAGTTTQVTTNGILKSGNQKINAFGYNPKDGYLWGFVFNTNQLVRVASDYSTQLFTIQGLGTSGDFVVGDIDVNGKMYLTHGGSAVAGNASINIRVVDLNGAATSTTLSYTTLPSAGPAAFISDWAVSPQDNNLYALDCTRNAANGNPLTLYRFNAQTGTRETLGVVAGGTPAVAANTFGSVFMDLNGSMYVVANETGYIHRLDRPDLLAASTTATIPATYVATGPVATSANQNNNDGARCAASHLGATPLPVALVSFTAAAAPGRRVQLAWATASEVNSHHFEVQHSREGNTFTTIGQVASRGTTSRASTYSLTDAAPSAGPTHYYRLRQVDQDGRSTFSPVQAVTLAPGASVGPLTVLPNPSTGDNLSVQVQYEGPVAMPAVLTVYGLLGQAVCTQAVVLQPGTTTLIPTTRLVPGVYLFSLGGNDSLAIPRTRVLVTN
ncbi:MAG: DUF6923 family protein [Janthinobacterium lividum]